MLSLTCKTAIKAVIYLSSQSAEGVKTSIKEIAENIQASEHTVGKILQQLAKKKIIKSLKGPLGGFFLSTEQQAQPIIKIVKAIEGEEIFQECGLGLSKCSASHPCPVHDEYKVVREMMEKIFNDRTIQSLRESVINGKTYLVG